jgi:hypothetical protein
MAWERVEAQPRAQKAHDRIRGFMPFMEGCNVEGKLETVRINKKTNKGYYLIRATKSATVNVQDEDSLTGMGKAQVGELIGIRKTGATKVLTNIPLGALVSVTYIRLEEREGTNPKNGQLEMHPYHCIDIDVFKRETQLEVV